MLRITLVSAAAACRALDTQMPGLSVSQEKCSPSEAHFTDKTGSRGETHKAGYFRELGLCSSCSDYCVPGRSWVLWARGRLESSLLVQEMVTIMS